MVCSGIVTAQFIAGKATRDALYLAHLDVTTLPAMVVATSAVSILLVAISTRVLRRTAPGVFIPLIFAASAALLLAAWGIVSAAPKLAAGGVYLQISGIGPMLGSGFWLLASERFDPRTAKKRFGQIAGAGTLGGLAGGLLAERVAAGLSISAMLPILAALNLLCGWLVYRFAAGESTRVSPRLADIAPELLSEAPRSGLRVLAQVPYLRNLAALVLLGTAGAALMDYVFKVQAVAAFGQGDTLLRFFAVYYAAISLITFVVQASSSRLVLEKLGLAVSTGTPSLALLGGAAGSLIAPGLASAIAARGGESIFRGSLFRSSYEIFYTPIPPGEKRAAKSLIDVGFDRLGDAAGGGLIRGTLMLAPIYQNATLLLLAIGCSAAALLFASRLNRGYIHTLERSLMNRALELDLSDVEDTTTRTVMLRTLTGLQTPWKPARPPSGSGRPELVGERAGDHVRGVATPPRARPRPSTEESAKLDAEMRQIVALRSRDRDKVLGVLQSRQRAPATLVPHIIPLLAWDPVAAAALDALRRVAEERVGELVDALVDPNQEFAVRRRLARVFSASTSQRAVDGLMLGLNDHRFEVRFQCARSLATIAEKNRRVRINRDVIFEVVQRETAVGRPVWESHRLLNQLDDRDERFFVDEFVKDRASRSLAHAFTLLSLVLPAEPLRIAFRGLHTDDPNLRGTALEYLEGVLPPSIRERLWPFLEDPRPAATRTVRQRDEILADLLRSHASIMLNLEELQRRDDSAPSKPWQNT
jgi:AAA family ATP:ADP antiporter